MLTAVGDLFAEKFGATPPSVVALHGWARTGADFAPILAGLDAVALHLPGFGPTPEPGTAWGSEEYAEAVARAIEPFAPVTIVAHSFGGRVAVRLAARRPELVRALVLTGVPLLRLRPAPKPRLSFRLVRWAAGRRILPQSVLEAQRQKHGSPDYRAARGVMRDVLVRLLGEDYRDDLAAITAPVSMVWGELDDQAPADAGEAAAALVPGATFRLVPGAGHLMTGALGEAVREELLAVEARA